MTPDQEALSHLAVSYLTRLEVQGRIMSRWVPGMFGQGEGYFALHFTDFTTYLGREKGMFIVCPRPWELTSEAPDVFNEIGERWAPTELAMPDLSYPLTVQALLLLFREASGDDGAHTYRVAPGCWEVRWRVLGSTEQRTVGGGVTEAHVLVNAFEVLVNEIQR